MAARNRNTLPPFEVMTGLGRSARRTGSASESTEGAAPPGTSAGGGSWRQQLRQPIVIRVPRALAIATVALALGLLVLAYWVGHIRGSRTDSESGESRAGGAVQIEAGGAVAKAPGGGEGGAGSRQEGSSAGARKGPAGAETSEEALVRDPREPGLNYFILARRPRDAALEAARFLEKHGVDAAVVPQENTDLDLLIDARAYTSAELKKGAHQDQRRFLGMLGRTWKRHHGGAGDWSDLYIEKHQPGE
jgi:hypothetical protein